MADTRNSKNDHKLKSGEMKPAPAELNSPLQEKADVSVSAAVGVKVEKTETEIESGKSDGRIDAHFDLNLRIIRFTADFTNLWGRARLFVSGNRTTLIIGASLTTTLIGATLLTRGCHEEPPPQFLVKVSSIYGPVTKGELYLYDPEHSIAYPVKHLDEGNPARFDLKSVTKKLRIQIEDAVGFHDFKDETNVEGHYRAMLEANLLR